jgi:hypothetical protein
MVEDFEERRQFPRVDLEVQVALTAPRHPFPVLAWIENISRGGFMVRADDSAGGLFRSGEEVRFETSEDFFTLRGQGDVVWTSVRPPAAGVRFDRLDGESRRALDAFLSIFR